VETDSSYWEDPNANFKVAGPWKQIDAQVDMKFPDTNLVVSVDISKGFDSACKYQEGGLYFVSVV